MIGKRRALLCLLVLPAQPALLGCEFLTGDGAGPDDAGVVDIGDDGGVQDAGQE